MIKKTILLTIIAFSINIWDTYSQDFKLHVESISSTNLQKSDGEIMITVDGGKAEFIFFLYDDKPWEDANLIVKSDKTYNNTFSFTKLKKGTYYVGVLDSNGVSSFKKVMVQ